MMKNKRLLGIIIACVTLVTLMAIGAIAANSTNQNAPQTPISNDTSSKNPEDTLNYIDVDNQNGLYIYNQEVNGGNDSAVVGQVKIVGDYMYVYGYYYDSNKAPQTKDAQGNDITFLTGDSYNWKRQGREDAQGWGCRVIDIGKTSYADPAGMVDGAIVTYMTNTYAGCTKLKTSASNFWALPNIPPTVKYTTNLFSGCTGLKRAYLASLAEVSDTTFKGCTNLKQIFVAQNTESIATNAFPSNAWVAFDGAKTDSHKVTNYVNDFDIHIWTLFNIESVTDGKPVLTKIS
jgi:hypothetical protein